MAQLRMQRQLVPLGGLDRLSHPRLYLPDNFVDTRAPFASHDSTFHSNYYPHSRGMFHRNIDILGICGTLDLDLVVTYSFLVVRFVCGVVLFFEPLFGGRYSSVPEPWWYHGVPPHSNARSTSHVGYHGQPESIVAIVCGPREQNSNGPEILTPTSHRPLQLLPTLVMRGPLCQCLELINAIKLSTSHRGLIPPMKPCLIPSRLVPK
mmetsp:Transcript_2643/g.4796  ORF Transcript_2643/g.4796 Transcript_2643/m.4796 type:complete len:207 (+) Transcript_2643:1079-1699(+)